MSIYWGNIFESISKVRQYHVITLRPHSHSLFI